MNSYLHWYLCLIVLEPWANSMVGWEVPGPARTSGETEP